jgi:hypothetical protein
MCIEKLLEGVLVYFIFTYSINCTFWYDSCTQMPGSGLVVVERGILYYPEDDMLNECRSFDVSNSGFVSQSRDQ